MMMNKMPRAGAPHMAWPLNPMSISPPNLPSMGTYARAITDKVGHIHHQKNKER